MERTENEKAQASPCSQPSRTLGWKSLGGRPYPRLTSVDSNDPAGDHKPSDVQCCWDRARDLRQERITSVDRPFFSVEK